MAGNNSIQFVRGTSSKRASHTETSLAGQPIYETDTNRLYVGDGETSVNDLTAVEASAADIAENVKDQNNGAGIKLWIGTQAEFEDLETDEDTIYYITDIVSVLEVDEALKTLKEQLTSGAFRVSKAGAADNVTAQINGNTISSIFESDGTTVKKATNVTTNINGKAITSIFETNGTTVKEATHAGSADEATHAEAADSATNVTGQINGKAITSIFETDGTTVKKATQVDALLIDDNRSTNRPPSYYYADGSRVISEFKQCRTVGLSASETYCIMVTVCPWTDDSGGAITQTAYIGDEVYIRKSTSDSGWGSWASVFTTDPSKLLPSTANGWTETTKTGMLPSSGIYMIYIPHGDTGDNGIGIMVYDDESVYAGCTLPSVGGPLSASYVPSGSGDHWMLSAGMGLLDIQEVYYKRIA